MFCFVHYRYNYYPLFFLMTHHLLYLCTGESHTTPIVWLLQIFLFFSLRFLNNDQYSTKLQTLSMFSTIQSQHMGVGKGMGHQHPSLFPRGKSTNPFVLLFSNKQCLKIILSVEAVNCKAHEEPVPALLHMSLSINTSLRHLSPSSPSAPHTKKILSGVSAVKTNRGPADGKEAALSLWLLQDSSRKELRKARGDESSGIVLYTSRLQDLQKYSLQSRDSPGRGLGP